MSASEFTTLLDLVASVLLLSSVIIVWRRDYGAMIKLLVVQGVAVGGIPLVSGIYLKDLQLVVVGMMVILLRGGVLPWVLSRRLADETAGSRETKPLVNTTSALFLTALLVMVGYLVTHPMLRRASTPETRAIPAAFAVILIGVFLLVSRKRALSQGIGFLVMDNGIDAVAFLATLGVPVIIEIGASFDLLLVLAILVILTGRMHAKFKDTDLDALSELRD